MPKKFKNSRIRKLQPEGIVDKNTDINELEIEIFFLSLALIYNDIKGLVIMEQTVMKSYEAPEKDEVSEHAGEWTGIKLQFFKYFSSVLREALDLIEKKKDLIQSTSFQNYCNKLNRSDKNIWYLLLNIVGIEAPVDYNKENIKLFNKLLKLIRNKMSFHYDVAGDFLVKGYRRHFYQNKGLPGTDSAMYSAQKTSFYETRYYYADAALGGFLRNEFDKMPNKDTVIADTYKTAIRVAKVIMGLLEEYHKNKRKN